MNEFFSNPMLVWFYFALFMGTIGMSWLTFQSIKENYPTIEHKKD